MNKNTSEKIIYKDYLPVNARIIIDYNAKKGEKVKFSFPHNFSYKQAISKRAFPTVFLFWVILHIRIIKFIIIFGCIYLIFYFYYFRNVLFYSFTNSYIETRTIIHNPLDIYYGIIGVLIIIFYIFIIPLIITYYYARDKNKLSKLIPRLGYLSGKWLYGLSEIIYHKEDFKENFVLLPVFKNIYIEWMPKKDFAKYLEKIEIIELPFKHIRYNFFFNKKIKSKKYNEYYFSAKFIFSNIPRNGEMKIIYI